MATWPGFVGSNATAWKSGCRSQPRFFQVAPPSVGAVDAAGLRAAGRSRTRRPRRRRSGWSGRPRRRCRRSTGCRSSRRPRRSRPAAVVAGRQSASSWRRRWSTSRSARCGRRRRPSTGSRRTARRRQPGDGCEIASAKRMPLSAEVRRGEAEVHDRRPGRCRRRCSCRSRRDQNEAYRTFGFCGSISRSVAPWALGRPRAAASSDAAVGATPRCRSASAAGRSRGASRRGRAATAA